MNALDRREAQPSSSGGLATGWGDRSDLRSCIYEIGVQSQNDDRWSEEMYRMTGLDPEAGAPGIGEFIATFVHPDEQERVHVVIGHAMRRAQAFSIEYRLVTACGSVRTVRMTGRPFRDRRGRVVSLLCMIEDITGGTFEWSVPTGGMKLQQRIGEYIHDGLGSHLSGTAMLARSIASKLRDGKPVCPEELDEIAGLVGEGLEQARKLARGIIPSQRASQGVADALREAVAAHGSCSGIAITFESHPALDELRGNLAVQIYWITREAITNAKKHARGARIDIRASVEGEMLIVAVSDDGVGMPETIDAAAGVGMQIMRLRAKAIDGAIEIDSERGKGTTVRCLVRMASVGHMGNIGEILKR